MQIQFDHTYARNALVAIDLSENPLGPEGPMPTSGTAGAVPNSELRIRVTFTPARFSKTIVGLHEVRLRGRFHECEARRSEDSDQSDSVETRITTTRGEESGTSGTFGIKLTNPELGLESKGRLQGQHEG